MPRHGGAVTTQQHLMLCVGVALFCKSGPCKILVEESSLIIQCDNSNAMSNCNKISVELLKKRFARFRMRERLSK